MRNESKLTILAFWIQIKFSQTFFGSNKNIFFPLTVVLSILQSQGDKEQFIF